MNIIDRRDIMHPNRHLTLSTDKQRFFSTVKTREDVEALASQKDYRFLVKHITSIEQEFNHLLSVLNNNERDHDEYWLYCYYCSILLVNFYTFYDKKEKAREYDERAKAILVQQKLEKTTDNPITVTTVRTKLGQGNMLRLQYTFSKISVQQVALLVKDAQWLIKLNEILGTNINIDNMISMLNTPTNLLNALSVGLFAARLCINVSMVLKHTFSPTDAENLLTKWERCRHELYKRYYHILNDLAWGVTNVFCNYNTYFNISSGTACWLTAGFLVFDLVLLIVDHQVKREEYLAKQSQYLAEKKRYSQLMEDASCSSQDRLNYLKHCDMLDKQIRQLNIGWENTNAAYYFSMAAAAVLATGFTAAFLFTTPAVVVAGFLACLLATAMYMSGDLYGEYKEKCYVLQLAELENKNTSDASSEVQIAQQKLIKSLVKNTTIPLFIMTTFAVCWPAAIVFAVAYYAYDNDVLKKLPCGTTEATKLDAGNDAHVEEISSCPLQCG